MSKLTTNTTDLQAILDKVNALPDAGSNEPVLQEKTATPTTSSQTISPDSGYDGLSEVTIVGDENLVAENIAMGVDIFGVTGTYAGGKVAVGTFQPTDKIAGANKLIASISGLGFTPSYILITARSTANLTTTNTVTALGVKPYYIAFCEKSGNIIRTQYLYNGYVRGTFTDETYASLTVNNDGFEFFTGSHQYCYVPTSFIYHYVAIE